MKKQIISVTLLCLIFTANAQTRVPDDGTSPIWYNNGNVGIGTSSPNSKLHITGNIYINSGVDDNHIYWGNHNMTMGTKPGDYAHNYFTLKPGGSSNGTLISVFSMYQANSESSHDLKIRFNTSGVSFFNGGNVGIGTGTPNDKLDVNGVIRYGSSGNNSIGRLSYGTNVITLEASSTNTSIRLREKNSSGILGTGLILNSEGNVGIGTILPDYKLDVIGTIRAREIKVDLNGADFVFENSYKLMPLNELEEFVREQKHLPEILPAKEMEKNGTELGEMNTRLLQKIEELTLYVIDQNKKLERQNIRIEQQDKELKVMKEELEKLKNASE